MKANVSETGTDWAHVVNSAKQIHLLTEDMLLKDGCGNLLISRQRHCVSWFKMTVSRSHLSGGKSQLHPLPALRSWVGYQNVPCLSLQHLQSGDENSTYFI